jgi:hypothetical protein
MKKLIIAEFLLVSGIMLFALNSYAKDVTILYTGETHAMLYPCSCPKESDGGIARRAALLKQLKKKYPDALVLDSGGFTAGGLMDEYSQNTDLDKERTKVNLKAMEMMGYAAAAIGDDELNFGENFFEGNTVLIKVPMLSCNLKADKVLPYVIKDVAGVKIGITAATAIQTRKKVEKFEVSEPKAKLGETISELKKKGANIIVVLSHLSEAEESLLLGEVPGIDIIIAGHTRLNKPQAEKLGSTLVLRPSWQGRHLGRVTFSVKDDLIADYKTEDLRLSDKIADDKEIREILPRCFSDANCKKEGLIGLCQNPGNLSSSCLFTEAQKVNLTVITSKACTICDDEAVSKSLKRNFPGLTVNRLYYPESEKARKLVKDFGITGLPVYFLGREVEKESRFNDIKTTLELKDDLYLLRPQYFGYNYFIGRERIKGRTDIFISLFDKEKNPLGLLEAARVLKPEVHFLVTEVGGRFEALKQDAEVEESLRGVCVKKYYPEEFMDYLICRARNIDSSWWEDCLSKKADIAKIKTCAQSEEGRNLLKENIALGKELDIMFGPSCLADNQEISACSAPAEKKK